MRLIPAWAGKTATIAYSDRPSTAHPRVGGENEKAAQVMRLEVGSSPRGRGKRCRGRGIFARARLIPAWAGKTGDLPLSGHQDQAHPRVGGENQVVTDTLWSPNGSSPRGRGKPYMPVLAPAPWRLIPAWAGKTADRCCIDSPTTAHPRVGGENLTRIIKLPSKVGSSPRGRGKPLQDL